MTQPPNPLFEPPYGRRFAARGLPVTPPFPCYRLKRVFSGRPACGHCPQCGWTNLCSRWLPPAITRTIDLVPKCPGHATPPLNSSMPATRPSMSGVIWTLADRIIVSRRTPFFRPFPPVSTHFPVAAWSGEVQRPQPRAGRFTSTIPTATSSTASTSCRPTGSASQAEPISNAKTGVRNTNTEMRVAG